MNVLVYIPPPPEVQLGEQRELPIGALIIGTYAKHAGHNVKIIDGLASNSFAKAGDGFVPDVVGISMLTMYSALVMDDIRSFLAEVRKVSDPVIVCGGPGSSVMSEAILNDRLTDYVVFGPGEDVFVRLLSALESGSPVSEVSDIAYLDGGSYVKTPRTKCSGECLSLQTDFSLMDITRYVNCSHVKNGNAIGIYTSRGCLYRCTFCFNEAFYRCSYQTRPVPLIIAEMKYLNEHYGITYFRMYDECFGFDNAWLHEFCNAIIAELPPVTWWCMYRGGMNAREDYELMRRAGCDIVMLGIETGDPQMGRKIRKNLNLESLPAEIQMLKEMGFFVFGYFILGFPDETREQLKHTCDFMLASKLDGFYVSYFYLIPDTGMFEELASAGRAATPKTISEFQAYLSPKRYPNYSNIPKRELDTVYAFMCLVPRFEYLLNGGNILKKVVPYIKSRTMGGGGSVRLLFISWLHFGKLMWWYAIHPRILRRYGLRAKNFQHFPYPKDIW